MCAWGTDGDLYPLLVNPPRSVLSPELLPASIAIYLTVALVAFEGLAVSAALPQVAADLGYIDLLPWVITAYLLTSGVATVVAGPLVDSLGTRTMFRWSVGLFTVAGTIAAFAPSMPLMVGARLLQGAGGGLVVAVGLAAVGLVYPSHLVGRAFAANSTVWGVMGVMGPALAALLLTVASWRWIFGVNLPLGLICLVAGWKVMPGPTEGAEKASVDLIGAGLITGFLLTTLLAVDELSWLSVPWLLSALTIAYLYSRHARRVPRPVLRLEHLLRQPYSGLAGGIGLMLAGAVGVNAFLPLYVQGGRGGTPALAAWSVLFFTIGWTTGSNLAALATRRESESLVTMSGFAFTLPGLGLVSASVWAGSPIWFVFAAFTVVGVGIGISTNAALTLLGDRTPSGQIGRAVAGHHFARSQGFTFGIALAGAVILLAVAARIGDVEAVQSLLAGEASDAGAATAGAIESGFGLAALIALGISSLGIVPIYRMRKHLAEARLARGRRR